MRGGGFGQSGFSRSQQSPVAGLPPAIHADTADGFETPPPSQLHQHPVKTARDPGRGQGQVVRSTMLNQTTDSTNNDPAATRTRPSGAPSRGASPRHHAAKEPPTASWGSRGRRCDSQAVSTKVSRRTGDGFCFGLGARKLTVESSKLTIFSRRTGAGGEQINVTKRLVFPALQQADRDFAGGPLRKGLEVKAAFAVGNNKPALSNGTGGPFRF